MSVGLVLRRSALSPVVVVFLTLAAAVPGTSDTQLVSARSQERLQALVASDALARVGDAIADLQSDDAYGELLYLAYQLREAEIGPRVSLHDPILTRSEQARAILSASSKPLEPVGDYAVDASVERINRVTQMSDFAVVAEAFIALLDDPALANLVNVESSESTMGTTMLLAGWNPLKALATALAYVGAGLAMIGAAAACGATLVCVAVAVGSGVSAMVAISLSAIDDIRQDQGTEIEDIRCTAAARCTIDTLAARSGASLVDSQTVVNVWRTQPPECPSRCIYGGWDYMSQNTRTLVASSNGVRIYNIHSEFFPDSWYAERAVCSATVDVSVRAKWDTGPDTTDSEARSKPVTSTSCPF